MIFAAGGNDTVKGLDGSDSIDGGGGKDMLIGNGGKDMLRGGGGKDTLMGGGGKDTLEGGGDKDVIDGGRGKDVLTGNGGADTFVFGKRANKDTITDFRQGQDLIQITDGAEAFADLAISQAGDGVRIAFGGGEVTVLDSLVADFDETDFIF